MKLYILLTPASHYFETVKEVICSPIEILGMRIITCISWKKSANPSLRLPQSGLMNILPFFCKAAEPIVGSRYRKYC